MAQTRYKITCRTSPPPDLAARIQAVHAAAIEFRQRLVPNPHRPIAPSGVAVDPRPTPQPESPNP